MDPYRARMAVGLLVPLAALAGCSSGSSSSKVTAGAMTSVIPAASAKTTGTSPSHLNTVAETEHIDPWKALVPPTQPATGARVWAHVGEGKATYAVPTGKKLAIRGACEGSGYVNVRIDGVNTVGFSCGAHLDDGFGSTLIDLPPKAKGRVEVIPSKTSHEWMIAAWSGATTP